MDKYKVKWINGMHYVIDTLREDKITSSGYHNENSAKTVCDKLNMADDMNGIVIIK